MFPNLGIFIFPQNCAIRQNRGHWFQIWQNQIPAQKYPSKPYCDPN